METIERSGLLNFVANQPEVLAKVAPGHVSVDLSTYFNKDGNLMFGNEHGLVLLAYIGDAMYEGHYLITDSMTPREAIKLCRRAIREAFTRHGAWAINGATPRGNLGARAFNRALGFRPIGSTHDTMGRPRIKYRLERATWEASLAESSGASGLL